MKKTVLALFLLLNGNSFCQDTVYARRIIDTLTSKVFFGRGYTNNGLSTATDFLVKEFVAAGLSPMNGKSFLQKLSFPVNTFPSDMSVSVNGKILRPGVDFIVVPDSRSIKGSFDLQQIDSTHYSDKAGRTFVALEDKLTWSVSKKVGEHSAIKILKSSLALKPEKIELNISNKFKNKFKTENICGFVKGKINPDSFLVFTAHYDHLGGMGADTYFPGANDNASGISLLLGLANYYSKHPQDYSMAFVCFTGEEAGLQGSEFFTKHPLIPLSSIRFLINLDLTGTGVEGITVVNATEFSAEFNLLKSINEKNHLLEAVNSRGKAKNSDHYWFTEKGVPSFFIYTLGGIKAYHDVHDISATLPNNKYSDLFRLLREFSSALIKN